MGFENGSVWRVVLRATKGTRQEVNTFHYDGDNASTVDGNDPQSLADIFRDDVRPVWASFFRPDWTIDPVQVVDEIDPQHPADPRSSWTSGAAIAGTNAGSAELLPSAVCVVTTLKTAHLGRRFTGRLFLGGSWNEGDQNGGAWTSGTIAGVETLIAAVPVQPDISPPGSPATAKWSVFSRTQRAQNLDPYLNEITAHIVRTPVHWLKRRAYIGL